MRSKKSNYIKGIVLFIIIFFTLEVIVLFQSNRFREQEVLLTSETLLDYKNDINLLFSKYIYLTQGFTINIESKLEDETVFYNDLERIFDISDSLINNIAIAKDTTIRFNYPILENKSSIGVDLAAVKEQSEDILLVKNHGDNIIVGPINLVQGGRGFILRSPIYYDNSYWGQVAVVFKESEVKKHLTLLGEKHELNIEVINKKTNNTIIETFENTLTSPIEINYPNYSLDWTIIAEPVDGWASITPITFFGTLIVILLTLTITVFYIKLLNAVNLLTYHANHDRLTNVYNRKYLDERLNSAIDESFGEDTQFGILNIDIDDFKSINDTFGHHVGDLVLIDVARNLEFICNQNCQIFRNGGDEFIILIFDIGSEDDVIDIRSNIKEHFSAQAILPNKKIVVSLSIGHATFPLDGLTANDIMNTSDHDMYKDKKKFHHYD